MELSFDDFFVFVMSPIFGLYFFIMAYRSWRHPDKIRKMWYQSYGNSQFMQNWIESRVYMWMARIVTSIGAILLLFVFVTAVIGFIFNLYRNFG
ncbi:MAG: hypothetical protein AAF490_27525 [Chloroflexota bacterium]